MSGTVAIDALPESTTRYRDSHAIVAVDAFRATTTIVTALAAGHRVYPVGSPEEAARVAAGLESPLLAGEVAGDRPPEFEMNNSPCLLDRRADHRPLVLLSSAGTRLLANARGAVATYIACFRNVSSTARFVAGRHERVAIIGAGTRGEPRLEDQIACAWIARRLTGFGYRPENLRTSEEIDRWGEADIAMISQSPSAAYLRSSGQEADIAYVLTHVDDLELVVAMDGAEATLVREVTATVKESRR
jgi:2-phosphosulfolactate phosphatase